MQHINTTVPCHSSESQPVAEDHCSHAHKQHTDVWHYPAWSGCTSLQASSQTSCLLVVHIPWLHTAICEGTGSPPVPGQRHRPGACRTRAGTQSAPGWQGYGTRGHCEIWLWYLDTPSPGRWPEEAQSPVTMPLRCAGDGLSRMRASGKDTCSRGSGGDHGIMKRQFNVPCV